MFRYYWKEIFEKDEDSKKYWDKEVTTGRLRRTFIDLFFYSFLQIKIQDKDLEIKSQDKNEFSKVEILFESYKKLIKEHSISKSDLLKEIKEYATIFKDNFDHSIVEKELTNEFGIERINAIIFGLDTSTLIPYALFVLKNVKNKTERNEIFEYLESYIMRRMIVKASTKNYNQLFTDRLISNNILSKENLKAYIAERSDKVNFYPSNEDLTKGFNNSALINKQAAGIIYFLESKIRNRNRQSTQLLGIRKYSLEHLMPKKWENNWDKLESKEKRDLRNKKLLTLGNLAIITQSLNASIRDSSWEIKKNGKENKHGLKQYSSGIETLSPYLELENWDELEIKKRADFLLEKAIETWKKEEKPVPNK